MPNAKLCRLKLLYLCMFFWELDWNNIGSKGVQLLVKAELPSL